MIFVAGFFLALIASSSVFADSTDTCSDNTAVESCARSYSYNLSFRDVIENMIQYPEVIPFYCQRERMKMCLGNCAEKYRTSKFGHTYSMCVFKRTIVKYKRCWTQSFLREAEYCYAHHFPAHRLASLYPIPIRLFSMSTIEEDCFSDEQDEDCRYYKSVILWNLMPTYYQAHVYPQEYISLFT